MDAGSGVKEVVTCAIKDGRGQKGRGRMDGWRRQSSGSLSSARAPLTFPYNSNIIKNGAVKLLQDIGSKSLRQGKGGKSKGVGVGMDTRWLETCFGLKWEMDGG